MPWTPDFRIDHRARTVEIIPVPPPSSSSSSPPSVPTAHTSTPSSTSHPPAPSPTAINNALSHLLHLALSRKTFRLLTGWRNEPYPIHSTPYTIERSAAALFGILTKGVHMTVYTLSPTGGMRIWVPRRAATKQTYPGMLDNSVAGGISAGESAFECLVREAGEEASLPASLVRENAKPHGSVSYFHIRDARAGGETGLLQPEVEYVYDMEVGEDVVLQPRDGEVETFYLWGVERVREALGRGEFKPNCAVVMVDFLVRHGCLTGENERDFERVVGRLRRELPFPMGGEDGGEGLEGARGGGV